MAMEAFLKMSIQNASVAKNVRCGRDYICAKFYALIPFCSIFTIIWCTIVFLGDNINMAQEISGDCERLYKKLLVVGSSQISFQN